MKFIFAAILLTKAATAMGPNATWVFGDGTVPVNAVPISEDPALNAYVCRSFYNEGTHPGQLQDGQCHIEWGGEEVIPDNHEVLLEEPGYFRWMPGSNGEFPPDAFLAGDEKGVNLYSCAVDLVLEDENGGVIEAGMRAGKLIGQNCNIAYQGFGYESPDYAVLVVDPVPTAVRPVSRLKRVAGPKGNLSGFDLNGRMLPRLQVTAPKDAPYLISR